MCSHYEAETPEKMRERTGFALGCIGLAARSAAPQRGFAKELKQGLDLQRTARDSRSVWKL